MGQIKAKRGIQETRHRNSRLCVEADEKNFSFVNESPRRLLSRRAAAGIEGCGALRSFALTTQLRLKETGRNARTLKRDQGGSCGSVGRARRVDGACADFWWSQTRGDRVSARKYGNCRRHVLVSQLDPASGDHWHLAACVGAHHLYRVAFQRDREPRALPPDAQRCSRIRLDRGASAYSGHHSRALVPAACATTHHPRAGPDAEGDGLAMALELRLPEVRGRLFVRLALCRGKGPEPKSAEHHHCRSRDGCAGWQGRRS